MKSLLQATFAAITIATLAGCAAPLPKGSDTSKYLPTPVDVSKMKPVEMTLKAKNGDEYDALRFHDVAANKWFDSDGYPVNEKFLRVRKDGFVCEGEYVGLIANMPDFKTPTGEKSDIIACVENMHVQKAEKRAFTISGVGAVLGGPIVAASTAAGFIGGTTVDAVNAVTADKAAE
jgi:hypothetical protein